MPSNENLLKFKNVSVTVTSEDGQGLQELKPANDISIDPSKTLSDLLKKVGNVPNYPVVEIKLDGKRKEEPKEDDKLSKLLEDLNLGGKKEFNMLAIYVAGKFRNAKGENSYDYRK